MHFIGMVGEEDNSDIVRGVFVPRPDSRNLLDVYICSVCFRVRALLKTGGRFCHVCQAHIVIGAPSATGRPRRTQRGLFMAVRFWFRCENSMTPLLVKWSFQAFLLGFGSGTRCPRRPFLGETTGGKTAVAIVPSQ